MIKLFLYSFVLSSIFLVGSPVLGTDNREKELKPPTRNTAPPRPPRQLDLTVNATTPPQPSRQLNATTPGNPFLKKFQISNQTSKKLYPETLSAEQLELDSVNKNYLSQMKIAATFKNPL